MERHGPHLRACLEPLYGAARGFDAWFDHLTAQLAAAAADRPAPLLALDRTREGDPNWFLRSDMIGYSAYVDRFAGSLSGLTGRIDYLRELGVRYLHLLPFWATRAGDSDGGFAVSDYNAVRPDVGDIADLAPLADALRAAGISLCVDLVLNHTADDHPWAVAARGGDTRFQAYYHLIDDERLVQAYEAGLDQVFPATAPGNFTYCAPLKAWVWTTFYPFQWDLNWANPAVFGEMAAVILGLANRGVEAFRLDSAAYLWKRLGGPSRGEPQTHLVLQALRAILAIAAPSVLLKSEVIAPVAETVRYLGAAAAPECHLAYHSGLMTAGWAALAEGSGDLVRRVLAEVPALPAGAGWITYVRCHDDIGWMVLAPQAGASPDEAQARLARVAEVYTRGGAEDFARGESFQTGDGVAVRGLNGMAASLTGIEAAVDQHELDRAIDRLTLLYSLAYAAGGTPVIYMGDELGQTNDQGFRDDPLKAHEGRWLHRPAFDEALAEQAADTASVAGRIHGRLKALAWARAELPPLTPQTVPEVLAGLPDAVVGLRRGLDDIALFNFSGEPQTISLDVQAGEIWRDRLFGDPRGSRIVLAGYGSAWLTRVKS